MSGRAPDPRLDALLRDLPAPPVPAGLAARIMDAAAGTAQEPRPARARRVAARRDRRGRWLRRPLLAGTVALGLLVTSAVAATLAGVPIPQKIAAVFFPEAKAPAPKEASPPPRRASRPATPAPARPVAIADAGPKPEAAWSQPPGHWNQLLRIQRMAEERRAMGLPTPGADRMERQLRHRAEMWSRATPEQRQRWLDRQQERRAARQAGMAAPETQETLAGQRALLRRWRAQREAGIPYTPEQRAARQEMFREWRARGFANVPPAAEEHLARQERFRRWREARRARWQSEEAQAADNLPDPRGGTEPADR